MLDWSHRSADGQAVVHTFSLDVQDANGIKEALEFTDEQQPLDLVIANAGVIPDTAGESDGLSGTLPLFKINVLGMFNTILPIVQRFRERKQGQIVMMSSLGGYAPPMNLYMTPYIASKTAIRMYGEGLRASLYDDNIGVTVVCPGM